MGEKSEICHWMWRWWKCLIWAVGIWFELPFSQIYRKNVKLLLPRLAGIFLQSRAESLSLSTWSELLYFSVWVAAYLLGQKMREKFASTQHRPLTLFLSSGFLDLDTFPWRCLVWMRWLLLLTNSQPPPGSRGPSQWETAGGEEAAAWELAVQEGWRAVSWRSGSRGPQKGDEPSQQLAEDQP